VAISLRINEQTNFKFIATLQCVPIFPFSFILLHVCVGCTACYNHADIHNVNSGMLQHFVFYNFHCLRITVTLSLYTFVTKFFFGWLLEYETLRDGECQDMRLIVRMW